MKNCLAVLGAVSVALLTMPAFADKQVHTAGLAKLAEDTFIRVPALEFTIASVELDSFIFGVPRNLTQTERAFSEIRPGVNYDDGMIWLTFKSGGKSSLLNQLRKLKITRRVRSSYRLSSPSPYDLSHSAIKHRYAFTAQAKTQKLPTPRPSQ